MNTEYVEMKNNKFKENNAKNETTMNPSGYGGGLYYTCTINYLCNLEMTENNTFINNYADNAGGGVKWDDLEPIG